MFATTLVVIYLPLFVHVIIIVWLILIIIPITIAIFYSNFSLKKINLIIDFSSSIVIITIAMA